jgi:hypothetical protein
MLFRNHPCTESPFEGREQARCAERVRTYRSANLPTFSENLESHQLA